jgi:hypothetical protein
MELKFSEEIRSRVSERDRSMMTICEQSVAALWSSVDSMTEHFLIPAPGDIREVHNNYVRAILASTSAKIGHPAPDITDGAGGKSRPVEWVGGSGRLRRAMRPGKEKRADALHASPK